MGDTTLVYWAEGAEPAYGSAFMAMMGMGGEEKNEITQKELNGVLTALCQGRTVNWANVPLNPKNRFYILGLAPNASRLSVRFFLRDSFGAFVEHYQKHQERLNIVRPAFDERETLSMWALLRETVNPNSRDKSAQPQLVGELLRAVLTGSLYPSAMFTQTEIRLRAEKDITRGKAAIIKAFLLRNVVEQQKEQIHVYKEVLDVELNEQSTYLPYRLGRLFAVLEAVQQRANPNINTTIKDRYFNSACATPALVFPTLLRLAQSHLGKIGGGAEVYYDKMITELLGDVTQSYPARLSLQDQGIFQLGYYHQKQKLFTKKEEKDNG
ncbi:MAG: type I-C CRISPR-associated protein Cas8c/Csd1 [Christensenellales bacterium]